jgi:16S rRNA (guanine(966)-N(2))-methyltransferase RsmD
MRVISGTAKGRKLRSVPGQATRPITDRVKEALFDIIGADVVGASWWDVFAGTGAVGIEALSRGAAYARFTDFHRVPLEIIKANLVHTGLDSRAEATRGDAFALLAAAPDRRFDYVYLAPPQYKGLWSRALTAIDGNVGWLTDEAWTIAQLDPNEYTSQRLQNLEEFDHRKYGSTLLSFYALRGA